MTLLHSRESVIRNNKLDKIKTIIIEESYLFVKKCNVKKSNKKIFDNYSEKLSHSNETWNNNAVLKLPSVKLAVSKQRFYIDGAKLSNATLLELWLMSDFDKFQSNLNAPIN